MALDECGLRKARRWLFLGHDGLLPLGIEGCADLAEGAVAASGGAMFATVEDDLQMQIIPRRFGKQLF